MSTPVSHKRADISDLEALRAVDEAWKQNCSPFDILCKKYPFKVALRKLEQLNSYRKNLIDYGTSINYPWLTDEGKKLLTDSFLHL